MTTIFLLTYFLDVKECFEYLYHVFAMCKSKTKVSNSGMLEFQMGITFFGPEITPKTIYFSESPESELFKNFQNFVPFRV